MLVKIVIIALCLVTVSAFPLHRRVRETSWQENHVHDKTQLKEVDNVYKSHISNSDLYSQDLDEMNRKLLLESERLRSRLRLQLHELRGRLASSSARPDAAVVDVKQRLSSLAHQLQDALRGSSRSLCRRLRKHLQDLDAEEVQAGSDGPDSYWTSSRPADIISDFEQKTSGIIDGLKDKCEGQETRKELLEKLSLRLQQKVSSVKQEIEDQREVLKRQLQAELLVPSRAVASLEEFCQAADLHFQTLPGQFEGLFVGLEDEAWNPQSSGSLREDFSGQLSALVQDILRSVA